MTDAISKHFEHLKAMEEKFKSLGLAHESVKVFGMARLNVHVVCVGRETARKWAQALQKATNATRVSVVSHMWDAVENKGTCLLPTKRKGYLIAAVG